MDPIKVDFSKKDAGRKKDIVIPPEKAPLKIILSILCTVIFAAVAFYVMLPAINERATKKRINEEKAAAEKQKSDSLKAINPDFFAQSAKTQNIFSDFQ